jgi:hypothetical protein
VDTALRGTRRDWSVSISCQRVPLFSLQTASSTAMHQTQREGLWDDLTSTTQDYWALCVLMWGSGRHLLCLANLNHENGPNRVGVSPLRMETDPVSETLCSLEYRTMNKIKKSYTPLSEPFRIYLKESTFLLRNSISKVAMDWTEGFNSQQGQEVCS